MKVLSATQIREWDAYTIKQKPVRSIDLMNTAALAAQNHLKKEVKQHQRILIFCGTGNNGGDGMAMAANWKADGIEPQVYVVGNEETGSEDFKAQTEKAKRENVSIKNIKSHADLPKVFNSDLVIDALFGTGLSRPLSGIFSETVSTINNSEATVVSIDVPSGMYIDTTSKSNAVVKATETLTFQSRKTCFMMAENAPYFGRVTVLDIGLLPGYLDEIEAPHWVDSAFAKPVYRPRSDFSHKGNFGHALIVAGNAGKMGAALMCSKACLRSGAGLVTLDVPKAFLNAVHAYCPELMCKIREEDDYFSGFTTLGIGPGMGTDQVAKDLLMSALKQAKKPLLIDADAITILSTIDDPLTLLPANSIITPHPKEFDRLFGPSTDDFDRMNKAIEISRNYPVVVVLKGHRTLTAHGGEAWFNSSGNAGLAKGGTGDVLSGIITALLAQSYEPIQAAILGVYLHGLSADICAKTIAKESILATDVIDHISRAILAVANHQL